MDPPIVATLNSRCVKALDYPKNLIQPGAYPYNLDSYFKRLNEHEHRLFEDGGEAAVDFSEFATNAMGMSFLDYKRRILRGCRSFLAYSNKNHR